MKQSMFAVLVFMFTISHSGCATREYHRAFDGGSGNLQKDIAECSYESELNMLADSSTHTTVNVNINSNADKEAQKLAKKDQEDKRWERKKRIRHLRDLCLKSRGWIWDSRW